jgi:hypothetical protein
VPQLYYQHTSGWKVLPQWGQFFIKVGSAIASQPLAAHRVVLGLAIPTRAFAASLAATGVVTYLAYTKAFSAKDEVAHIEKICNLKAGNPLIYRKKNSVEKGLFETIYTLENTLYVKFKTQECGNQTTSVPQSLFLNIEPIDDDTFTLPKRKSTKPIVSRNEYEFISAYIGKELASKMITYSRTDCLIIGPKAQIYHEATESRFALKDETSSFLEGTLNMLMRFRTSGNINAAYRTKLISAADKSSDLEFTTAPRVVIFNGATNFLRWRHTCRNSHWIVLLNRTDSLFHEAVNELNQEYRLKRSETNPPNIPLNLPKQMESIYYYEELQ